MRTDVDEGSAPAGSAVRGGVAVLGLVVAFVAVPLGVWHLTP